MRHARHFLRLFSADCDRGRRVYQRARASGPEGFRHARALPGVGHPRGSGARAPPSRQRRVRRLSRRYQHAVGGGKALHSPVRELPRPRPDPREDHERGFGRQVPRPDQEQPEGAPRRQRHPGMQVVPPEDVRAAQHPQVHRERGTGTLPSTGARSPPSLEVHRLPQPPYDGGQVTNPWNKSAITRREFLDKCVEVGCQDVRLRRARGDDGQAGAWPRRCRRSAAKVTKTGGDLRLRGRHHQVHRLRLVRAGVQGREQRPRRLQPDLGGAVHLLPERRSHRELAGGRRERLRGSPADAQHAQGTRAAAGARLLRPQAVQPLHRHAVHPGLPGGGLVRHQGRRGPDRP